MSKHKAGIILMVVLCIALFIVGLTINYDKQDINDINILENTLKSNGIVNVTGTRGENSGNTEGTYYCYDNVINREIVYIPNEWVENRKTVSVWTNLDFNTSIDSVKNTTENKVATLEVKKYGVKDFYLYLEIKVVEVKQLKSIFNNVIDTIDENQKEIDNYKKEQADRAAKEAEQKKAKENAALQDIADITKPQ